MIDKPNVLIRVHKDGRILYSVRISLVLSCPMHLQVYINFIMVLLLSNLVPEGLILTEEEFNLEGL